jgi:hypothetical protein
LKYKNALIKSVSKLVASTYNEKQVHFIVNLLLKFSEHEIVDMIVDENVLKQSIDQVYNKKESCEASSDLIKNTSSNKKISVSVNADNIDENTFKKIVEQIRIDLSAKK